MYQSGKQKVAKRYPEGNKRVTRMYQKG
jgi:hypothetical protein